MTDEERNEEGAEEEIEDLEAPVEAQDDVAGGLGPCRPTNACNPTHTVVHCPKGNSITQMCEAPTCNITKVMVAG